MEDNGVPAVGQLEATPEILRGLMRELTEEDARWKPAPDRFSVAEGLHPGPVGRAEASLKVGPGFWKEVGMDVNGLHAYALPG